MLVGRIGEITEMTLQDASESRSSEDGERTGEVRGSLGPGISMGGVMGPIQDTDFLGNGDG